ncbi:macrophage mannose receptor 1-like [Mytilus edulis]|uniref:macrophage mannose receptor 1-like n=1 Tax=Mytilus edulis TaxID=6550 RepID=UPI0039EEA1DA
MSMRTCLVFFYMKSFRQITEKVWMSLTCVGLSCQWDDGEILDWANWENVDEPRYECVVFEEIFAFTWRSRRCLDNYISLCIAPAQPSFSLLSGLYNFYEASKECQAIGGQLAVLNNPVAMNRVMNELYDMTITNDIWIGLYGNGTNFVWQNMAEEVSYTNWNTTVPQTHTGVAVVMTKSDLTWRERQMTDRTDHTLCQVNYLPVVLGMTYADAEAECLKSALHPALMRTQEEAIIAKNALNTPNTVSENFWVGLTLNGTNYTWSDGTPALFTDWSLGEPNRLDIAHCVIIVGNEFQWDSKDCTTDDNVLCQYPTNNRFPISNDIDQIGDITTTTIGANYPDTPTTISATYPPISITTTIGANYPDTPTTISATYPPISTASVSAGEVTQRHYLLSGVDVEPQNQPYQVAQLRSKIRCADHCLADHVCAAFVFNGWQCLLYNSFNSGSVNQIAGSRIWK